MNRSRSYLVAEVVFSEQDGSIHAYSDDIPGLNVCGKEREVVLSDVIESIKYLYKHIHGRVVDAEWADSPATVFNGQKQRRDVEHLVMRPTFEQLVAQ